LSQAKQTGDVGTNEDTQPLVWNPQLRRVMGTVATIGAMETSYLTYNKLLNVADFCTVNGDCATVLNGPYATIPFTDIPLAAVGCLAYITTVVLSVGPLVDERVNNFNDDTWNRIALIGVTTAMGTFSIFLMSLLFGVLHESCPFCLVSAMLSLTLAGCAWIGGALPETARQTGLQASLASFAATTAAAVVIFIAGGDSAIAPSSSVLAESSSASSSSSLLASNSNKNEGLAPPPITTASSERAVELSAQLQVLNAKMYGAYWCSHCYEQKERLGKEAFARVQYIECSQDGKNSQRSLCQERNVPGYPTWEINGKLFPGERELDELEEIIVQVKSAKD
jgi:uncharacterized membrane protein